MMGGRFSYYSPKAPYESSSPNLDVWLCGGDWILNNPSTENISVQPSEPFIAYMQSGWNPDRVKRRIKMLLSLRSASMGLPAPSVNLLCYGMMWNQHVSQPLLKLPKPRLYKSRPSRAYLPIVRGRHQICSLRAPVFLIGEMKETWRYKTRPHLGTNHDTQPCLPAHHSLHITLSTPRCSTSISPSP